MIIEITPAKAQEIVDMFDDWDSEYSIKNPDYKIGYIAATKVLLDTFNLSEEDIREYLNKF